MALLRGLAAAALLLGSASGTNEVGTKFLKENMKRTGVITLASGLQYKVLTQGLGEDHPFVGTPCEVHYEGTTPSLTPDAHEKEGKDWALFDSSIWRGKSTTFAPNQVIKGWEEVMQLMVEGDKWEMYIPSDLGYGDSDTTKPTANIKGGDVLIFRMEILRIPEKGKPADRCDTDTTKGCNDKQKAFVEKHAKGTPEQRGAELKRLEVMQGVHINEMKPENRKWLASRTKLLKKMVKKDEL